MTKHLVRILLEGCYFLFNIIRCERKKPDLPNGLKVRDPSMKHIQVYVLVHVYICVYAYMH